MICSRQKFKYGYAFVGCDVRAFTLSAVRLEYLNSWSLASLFVFVCYVELPYTNYKKKLCFPLIDRKREPYE